jgi:uncharacterized protein (DUF1330 family)
MRTLLPGLVAALATSLTSETVTAQTPAPSADPFAVAALDPKRCDNKPVIMLVAGSIADWPRVRAYGQAIRDSGLYDKLAGYYLNVPRVIDTFEGEAPANQSMLIVRFPCLAHARAFWYSREYQEKLKPLRLNPSAGSFTVTVYPEASPPPGVAAHWPPAGAITRFAPEVAAGIPQQEPE